jgi:hypothetical protein
MATTLTTKNEIIAEIVRRLKAAFAAEKKVRKAWAKIGMPESVAPSALGLIGDERTGYECMRSAWWHGLDCDNIADDLDYDVITREIEKIKIKGLAFGS